MKTRFILINTSHAGNVGAVARAMKVMDFDDLVLVAPRWPNVLRREETIQRASGALDVLHQARIVETLDEALDGISHLCATAMTPRDFGPPTFAPRDYFEILLKKEHKNQLGSAVKPKKHLKNDGSEDASHGEPLVQAGIGFLFGCERFGMRNEDVYRCHAALQIPTHPRFGSLNLAAAVQVIAYDWRMALGGFVTDEQAGPSSVIGAVDAVVPPLALEIEPVRTLADAGQVAGMLTHWEQALTTIGFLDPEAPKKLMPRLNQLFNRARLEPEEIHILRGVAKAMISAAQAKR
jgi:tRNA/rRNA methyltransferase